MKDLGCLGWVLGWRVAAAAEWVASLHLWLQDDQHKRVPRYHRVLATVSEVVLVGYVGRER